MSQSIPHTGWWCIACIVPSLAAHDPGEQAVLSEMVAQPAEHRTERLASQAEPPPAMPATTNPTPAEKPDPGAETAVGTGNQAAAPASLQEAAAIIDFRTFPTLERKEVFHQTAARIGYSLAKPDLPKDVQFYRSKLSDAGWKLEPEKVDPEKHFGTFRCSKQGYFVDVTVCKDPNDGKMQVFLENQGNIDARTLPRPAGAEVTQSQPNVTIFQTDAKVAAVAEFVRGELKKLGWREAVFPGGEVGEEQDDYRCVMFIQRGMHFNALINAKDGKSEVMYSVSMLKVGLPIMPDAKGRIEHMEEPFLHLAYATPSKPEQVLEFYRREMPALGWLIRAGTDKIEDGKANVALEGAEKAPLRLELLSKGGPTIVLIANSPAGD